MYFQTKTIEYSKFLPNQLVQYSVFTPYPGTPIFNEFKDKIIAKNYEKFNLTPLFYQILKSNVVHGIFIDNLAFPT